eukprot:CAMPEP_0118963304 /NCGR_PEP_ID=MMETSP1173-20130426/1265_1 /TAXON_ID=1034831 /ORGANISM="Rhizochromulina marina cf, Strain CCMP1243" /LENGTH=204 /DNA_ID=CAMNT_0006911627 /DNA_START=113 /DNA_END=727 /DNA_ORIENTATION=+
MSLYQACSLVVFACLAADSAAFVPGGPRVSTTRPAVVRLQMGLFDGIKEAFNAEEGQAIDVDRETPFDRWMGISTKTANQNEQKKAAFVDSMDEVNYVKLELSKPMGIVFEENDPSTGGVFVASLADGGAAASEGSLMVGDQLVAVSGENVLGLVFDDALGKIVDSEGEKTGLIFFRGGVTNLYGNLGPADDWLSEFLAKRAVA